MQSLSILALGLLLATPSFASEPTGVTKIGEELLVFKETPHPAPVIEREGDAAWLDVFTYPGASYIAVHFQKFDLEPGERVVLQTPDGRYSYTFTGEGKPGLGGTFWATHVPGDTCEVRYYGSGEKPGFGYVVDKIAHGYPAPAGNGGSEATSSDTFTICDSDDSNWAKCYEATEPEIYNQSRAIARILVNGTTACTAWLVGCQGHILTINHCIATNADAMNTDYEFMAEGATCETDCATLGGCPGTIVSSTGTLVATEATRDFSLVLLPVNVTPTYGYFKMRPTGPTIGERIYLPGHPNAWGKRFSVTSTDPADTSGSCQVNSLNQPSCIGGGPPEVGYQCDTQGASYGSPVVAYDDDRVVALHHCGSCPNRGVPISDVIAGLGANLPQCAIQQFIGRIELLQEVYGCASSVNVRVRDDNLVGTGSLLVTLASTIEAEENVTLTEAPASSGTFLGSFPTTGAAPVHGDGQLSVSNGATITGTYIDADDGQGGMNVPRQATALADCVAPAITNVQATNVTGGGAVITWTTNEPSNGLVSYGTSTPPGSMATSAVLVMSHSVTLTGLAPCSVHYFSVGSTDAAGNSASDANGGTYYTFTTGQNTTPSFPSTDTPISIPDHDATGITSTINVQDNKTVIDVDVKVNVTHPYDGDLILRLVTPTNTSILLSNRQGGSGENFTDTLFDDEASTPIASGTAPFTGSFRPDSPLSAADGVNPAGQWTLRVSDNANTDTGTLVNWTLRPTYPPQTCGSHAAFESRAVIDDTCPGGGPSNQNGVVEAGEQIQFSVAIRNDGGIPLTGIAGTVVPLTAGVTMLDATAGYNNLAADSIGNSLAPHYAAKLPVGLSCGNTINFQIAIHSTQGDFTGTFSIGVGQIIPGGGTALSENFAGGIPATWTIVNGGSGGGTAATWTTANPGGRTLTVPIVAPMAIVDSDNAGASASQDEQLVTPVLNLSTATTVTLDYDEFFRWFSAGLNEKGDVDVRSSLTGGAWVNVVRNQGASNPPQATTTGVAHRTVNITAQAAGAGNVQIRFHYYSGQFEWWWEVDNVAVTFTGPGGCNMAECSALLPPPPVPDGTFGTPMRAERASPSGTAINVQWDVATCSAPGYHVLYGLLSGVSTHSIGGGVCAIGDSGGYFWANVPSGNLWFVIVADNTSSLEGTWGRDSSGADRHGTTPSGACGITARDNRGACEP